jgi:two-component system phosphate regulon sensor histidine kinase PhoR
MAKRKLQFIIVLMSLALLGLIAFQGYWVYQTIKANEERFNTQVQNALAGVVKKVEMKELVRGSQDLLLNSFRIDQVRVFSDENAHLSKTDSLRVSINNIAKEKMQVLEKAQLQAMEHQEKVWVEWQKEFETLNKETPKMAVDKLTFDISNMQDPDMSGVIDELEKIEERLTEKTRAFEIIINNIINDKRKILNRIDKEEIDSLLTKELQNKGIELAYNFKVFNENKVPVTGKSQIHTNNLASFTTQLFPNDVFGNSSMLKVEFPNRTGYLIRKSGFTLASSVILIGIIIYCFSFAVLTILRQKKLSEMKNDFINNMTHEFKTPISTVSLATEALSEQEIGDNTDMRKRYLGIIKDENTRLGQQVEKVLQIAALDKKDFNLKREDFNLHAVISKVLKSLDMQLAQKHISVDFLQEAKDDLLNADKVHITNALYNLIDNAIKYGKENGQIVVRTEQYENILKVQVGDDGPGISDQDQKLIFDKFYRVHTGNLHDIKGFGLGLPYVKSILDAHGGAISVKSTLGKGSTFTITIPKN